MKHNFRNNQFSAKTAVFGFGRNSFGGKIWKIVNIDVSLGLFVMRLVLREIYTRVNGCSEGSEINAVKYCVIHTHALCCS